MSEGAFYALKPIQKGSLPSATTLSQQKVIETLQSRKAKNTIGKFIMENIRNLEEFQGQAFGVFETEAEAKVFSQNIRKAARSLGWVRGEKMSTRVLVSCSISKVENGYVVYMVRVPALDTLIQRYVETYVSADAEKAEAVKA